MSGTDFLFGLKDQSYDAAVSLIPVPWEATASYGKGAGSGPEAVRAASVQVDLADLQFGSVWKSGLTWRPTAETIRNWDRQAADDAHRVIENDGIQGNPELAEAVSRVDALGGQVAGLVEEHAKQAFASGQIPAVLGGDHSSPLGLIRASARRHPGLGILHIDAHADLRLAYLGFAGSHASIMRNVLAIEEVGRLVGVGYRDIGDEEGDLLRTGAPRLVPFFDQLLASRMANGDRWTDICAEIVDVLPEQVHLSMDIDGLDPSLCPTTGTPVPGGLGFHQLGLLLETLSRRRRVVSFDLCEVVPGVPIAGKADGWDAIVGARVLYKLIGCAVRSQEGWLERGGAKVGSVWL